MSTVAIRPIRAMVVRLDRLGDEDLDQHVFKKLKGIYNKTKQEEVVGYIATSGPHYNADIWSVGFSLCHPMDYPTFDHDLGKHIAKTRNGYASSGVPLEKRADTVKSSHLIHLIHGDRRSQYWVPHWHASIEYVACHHATLHRTFWRANRRINYYFITPIAEQMASHVRDLRMMLPKKDKQEETQEAL